MQILLMSLVFVENENMCVFCGNTYWTKDLVYGSDQSLSAPYFFCTFEKDLTIEKLILRAPKVTAVVMVNAVSGS